MNDVLAIFVLGLASAAIYAVAASGLVLTYTTSGIFNFAHGAVAMLSAFVYWQLSSPNAWNLPVPVALVLTIGVFAPGLGFIIERGLMRRLDDASTITRIVVPIGLLVALIQIATVIWPPAEINATLPRFFDGSTVELFDVVIEYHQLVVFATAILVAVGLRLLLFKSRVGVAMRAVVDSRELAALNGASPNRVSALSWGLGSALAGIAGVLIAPIISLDQTQLTLLVINAYAAAVVGRLRSLPWTAVGALILGLARETASRYQESIPPWINVDTIPAIMLFIVLVIVPQDKAAVFGARQDRSKVPNPPVAMAAIASALLVAVAFILPSFVHGSALDTIGYGLGLSIIALSLVPLTGWAGQISLAPLAFAGIGAVVMMKLGSDGNPLALIGVVVITGAVGALVALPTLRLKGLYLALSTMAFALFCEKAVFTQIDLFKDGLASYERLHIGGAGTTSQRANLVLMAAMFALMGMGLTALRRGATGRRLQAMKDSPAACATMGLDLTALKLGVFAMSAAMAGVGGALLAGWRGKVGPEQFALLQGALPGLPLVLLAVVGGIAAIAGALFGGMMLAVMPLVGTTYPQLATLMTILPGLAGISLANNPDGAVAQTISQVRAAFDRSARTDARTSDSLLARARDLLAPARPTVIPESIPVGSSFRAGDLAAIDEETGLGWGACHVDA